MSHLFGHHTTTGESNDFHPIEAYKESDGTYILRVDTTGAPTHYNGNADTVGTGITTVNLAGISKSLIIENLHATADLFVSFDGNSNTWTIPAGKDLKLDARVTSLNLSASVDTTPYQILTTE